MPIDSTNITTDEYDVNLGYHPSSPPLDIRLGIPTPPFHNQPPLRWGILATGKVAHDFVQALKFLPRHKINAVGSRTLVRANWFASVHNIPTTYGSYEELCQDPYVDIVYVASLHPDHKDHAVMALKHGKHVLVEKPMTTRVEDAELLYEMGREKNLFVGEGMWTRFFPAVEWTRYHLGRVDREGYSEYSTAVYSDYSKDVSVQDTIGDVRVVQADFSIDGQDVGPYPSDSLYSKELGGGSAWTLLPYIVSASMLPFGGKGPDRIVANGINPDDDAVGDLAIGMTMTFTIDNDEQQQQQQKQKKKQENPPPPTNKAIASGVVGYLAESSEITTYAGKKGRIIVNTPAHCPTSATMIQKSVGFRGGITNKDSWHHPNTDRVEFPLPLPTQEINDSFGFKMPNSMGFIYEAEAVRRLINAKYYTFPQWTPEESVNCIRCIEKVLDQIESA